MVVNFQLKKPQSSTSWQRNRKKKMIGILPQGSTNQSKMSWQSIQELKEETFRVFFDSQQCIMTSYFRLKVSH